jgi:hypothetical protein
MASSLVINKDLHRRKAEVLAYFRHRAEEVLTEVRQTYGEEDYKERASGVNRGLVEEKERLVSSSRQIAVREGWANKEILLNVLMISHCANVVMLEARNLVWPYDYMTFSRRVGELWEPFCNDCFEYPLREDVALFVPPVFNDIRRRLAREIRDFIAGLPLNDDQKAALLNYYDKVWSLVTSGEIKLALDLHFAIGQKRYVVDFKSGFSSNEKGNTNRLLLVASIYKNIEPEDYSCLLLVRSKEDENNHYLQTLKNSKLWEVYCGAAAYAKIREYSGFGIARWMHKNILWGKDLDKGTRDFLKRRDLLKYLKW